MISLRSSASRWAFSGTPISARELAVRLEIGSPISLLLLVKRLSGFTALRNGFPFNNSWHMTARDASLIRGHFDVTLDFGVPLVLSSLTRLLGDLGLLDVANEEAVNTAAKPRVRETILDSIILAGAPETYGMCGGMAFAALDCFWLGWDVRNLAPTSPAPPESGELREYILKRLLDSIDLNGATFIEWVTLVHILPVLLEIVLFAAGGPVAVLSEAWVRDAIAEMIIGRARAQLLEIKSQLDNARPVPMGLIYGDTISLFDQHQVVALDLKDLGDDTFNLTIWDNNLPDVSVTWKLDLRGRELVATRTPGTTRMLSGIFAERYDACVPASSLQNS